MIEDIFEALVTIEEDIEGIRYAFEVNPNTIVGKTPCIINFVDTGVVNDLPSCQETVHQIKIQLYSTNQDTPEADAAARPFLARILEAFSQNVTIGGTCRNSRITDYSYGRLTHGNTDYIGWHFNLEAVETRPLTYS